MAAFFKKNASVSVNSVVPASLNQEIYAPGGGLVFSLTTLFASGTSNAQPQVTAIRFGRLIDGRGGVTQNAVVLVEGERITAVLSGDATAPAGREAGSTSAASPASPG